MSSLRAATLSSLLSFLIITTASVHQFCAALYNLLPELWIYTAWLSALHSSSRQPVSACPSSQQQQQHTYAMFGGQASAPFCCCLDKLVELKNSNLIITFSGQRKELVFYLFICVFSTRIYLPSWSVFAIFYGSVRTVGDQRPGRQIVTAAVYSSLVVCGGRPK